MLENIFAKDIYEISLEDLIKFFESEQEESALIEFKSGECSWEDIYKEITAFVNTEGGVLIIGAPREKRIQDNKKNIRTFCQGELTASTTIKNKDSLYQKIASNIIPTPTNIKIQEIEYNNGKCYVLDIPKSVNPPHQCGADGKYYIRLEREAKFAPHGIVQALFNQRKKVDLNCKFYYGKSPIDHLLFFEIALENSLLLPAEDVQYYISVMGEKLQFNELGFKEVKRGKYTEYYISNFTNHSLVAGITHKYKIEFYNKGDWYYIFVLYWCKDTEAKTTIFKYEKQKGYIVQKSGDENVDILQEYRDFITDTDR